LGTNKLLLFDIDGTLITGRGIPKAAAIKVIHKRFPHFTNGYEIPFSGMTDPLIVQQVLNVNGMHIEPTDPLINEILDDFIVELAKNLNHKNPPDLLPGVKKLLIECSKKENIFLGLVTGNIMHGAKIKLAAAGIYKFFAVGAFGSDHWDRNKLPLIAINRALNYFNLDFNKDDIWIIGDSRKDVECAKKNRLKCLAVETGKTDVAQLKDADIILKNLNNIKDLSFILN